MNGQSSIGYLSEEEFSVLHRAPLSMKYAEVTAVKLVYDLAEKEIHFISPDYQYHYEFCREELGYSLPLGIFNRDNYAEDNAKRSFLLANINYLAGRDLYFLEISPSDHMSPTFLELLHKEVVQHSFLDANLELLLNSSYLSELSSKINVPTISSSALYGELEFQCVSKETTTGYLRKINLAELEEAFFSPDDILLINGTPLYLPQVAGVITTDFQTPLCHLSILGQNRSIPIMALTCAWDDEELNALVDLPIELHVNEGDYYVERIEKVKSKNPRRKSHLKFNLKETELIDARDFDRKTSLTCGYKAENFGVLMELSADLNFSVPEAAFGIPFYYYHEHAKACGATRLIESLSTLENPTEVLSEIRNLIRSTPVNKAHLDLITQKIKDKSTFNRIRFRSSTNAEDMKGFSGAGLYDSKTAVVSEPVLEEDKEKTIENSLRKVWASLWNDAAYLEREIFGFHQKDAMMGVLVHRSFPDEEVNGVVISKNIYRENNMGYVVNAQLENHSVVKPEPGVSCDQFICFPTEENGFYAQNNTVELISSSSLSEKTLLMTEEEIFNLANTVLQIKKYFYYRDFTTKTFNEFGLDLEFKLERDTRELYIKQVRPYNY